MELCQVPETRENDVDEGLEKEERYFSVLHINLNIDVSVFFIFVIEVIFPRYHEHLKTVKPTVASFFKDGKDAETDWRLGFGRQRSQPEEGTNAPTGHSFRKIKSETIWIELCYETGCRRQ